MLVAVTIEHFFIDDHMVVVLLMKLSAQGEKTLASANTVANIIINYYKISGLLPTKCP